MQIVVRQALISDIFSPFHGQTKDIFINNGTIDGIEDHIETRENVVFVQEDELIVSPGWVDSFAHFNDPGFEFKETLLSGSQAAAAGGFTEVFTLPNTSPVVDAKSQVEFITAKNHASTIQVHPLGAISKRIEGKELAEMFDMYNSGAIAFTDGLFPVQSSGLLLKALQYVKAFNGVILQMPIDRSIQPNGLMHEGILSAQLGLPGIPAIAEELMIEKMISLLRYTESKLHIAGVSSGRSLELIKAAKKEGLRLTCSIAPYHLFFCDEDLKDYDTNLKTPLPLRSRTDMIALREATRNGDIDIVASFHLPQEDDNKQCEFEYAGAGMNVIQNSFQVLNTVLPDLSNEQLTGLLSSNARRIFGLPTPNLQVGQQAEITLFNRNQEEVVRRQALRSRSNNNPFTDKTLRGKVFGIINKGKLLLNPIPKL